jgi:hypothetical protein
VKIVPGPEVYVTDIDPYELQFDNATGLYGTAGVLPINVTVTSYENVTYVTFNATVRFNQTEMVQIEVVTILFTLAPGQSNSTWFNCAIYNIAKGVVYNISVYVWYKPYQNDTDAWEGEPLYDGSVMVYVAGDVNRDDTTNILDSISIGNSFSANPGDSNWNTNADLNCDGKVNILDSIIVGNHFLEHYP